MGPMGMGMFPGPMGIPGPVSLKRFSTVTKSQGMGPFMPGLRPGLGGFGGPLGPVSTPCSFRSADSSCRTSCRVPDVLVFSLQVCPVRRATTGFQRPQDMAISGRVGPSWLVMLV